MLPWQCTRPRQLGPKVPCPRLPLPCCASFCRILSEGPDSAQWRLAHRTTPTFQNSSCNHVRSFIILIDIVDAIAHQIGSTATRQPLPHRSQVHPYLCRFEHCPTAEEADGRDLAQDPCHESQRDLRDLHGRVQGTTDWCLPLIPNLLVDSLVSLLPLPCKRAFPDCKPACTHDRCVRPFSWVLAGIGMLLSARSNTW